MSDPCKHLLDEKDARQLIPRLCAHFYSLGWVSGTGGGLSIRNDRIFVAPSGVQKELIRPDDIFELDANGTILVSPSNKQLKLSECNPLFQVIYAARNAGAVLHSHHISCSILTQLLRTNEFRISHQEMIKGIRSGDDVQRLRYDDTLVVPIIENTPFEKDLCSFLAVAIQKYPKTNAVLVRSHGVYIWGNDWIDTKTMAECYHYLFETAIKLLQFDLILDKN